MTDGAQPTGASEPEPGPEAASAPLPADWSVADLAVLATLAETFVPADPADPGEPTRRARLAAEAISRGLDPSQVRQLRLVLRIFRSHLAGVVLVGRPVSFRDLDRPARERYLLAWARSRFALRRSAFQSFRRLLSFIAYADPGEGTAENPRWTTSAYAPPIEPLTPTPTPIRPFELPAGSGEIDLDADVAIIGSGAGGGVVAAEVARAGRSVIVLEAGPFVPEPEMPADELSAFDRLYLDHGMTSTWDGSLSILAGACVGGGTTVNWTTCLRPPEPVAVEWAREHGLDGVDGSELDRDVEVLAEELGLSPPPSVPPKDQVILRGAAALGIEAAPTRRNAVDCGDCGSCGFGCRRGAKRSGLRAHLATAWSHGARIVPDAPVDRILVESGRAVGVEGTVRGRRYRVHARQVVVAGGALRTPVVLARSGLDHPAIGRNLHLHPVSVIAATYGEPIEMWCGTMQGARSLEYIGGPDGDGHGGFVIESAPAHLGLFALATPWESAAAHAERMRGARYEGALIAIVRDEGSGTVRPTGSGGARIDYRIGRSDADALRRGLVAAATMARAAGARRMTALGMPPEDLDLDGSPGDVALREAAFCDFLRRLERFSFAPNRAEVFSAHQMGSARMGADPRLHACDPGGRVRSGRGGRQGGIIDGLYIADTSVFPTAVGVNPMFTAMLLARRVSRTVIAEA